MAYNYYETDQDGICDISIESELLEQVKDGDGTANLLLIARSPQWAIGYQTVRIQVQSPPSKPVPVQVYPTTAAGATPATPSDTPEPLVVEFSTEVLDAILGLGGGASAAGSSTTTGVFDDRFFEERLRRLIGANVRAGDVAGLRREIDRVIVEEEVEGETQFVFRGAGSSRVARMAPGAAYTAPGGASSGYMKQAGMTSYPSANSHAYASAGAGSTNGGTAAGAPVASGFAGVQAILYRRAIGEFDHVRQALAALHPRIQEDSEEFESIRALVDEGLVDLVTAFGSELRPPVARVDGTFDDLLRESDTPGKEGFIFQLRRLGGYPVAPGQNPDVGSQNGAVFLTLAEEQEQTRYQELETYATGLRDLWLTFREQFCGRVDAVTLNTRSTAFGRRIGFVADAVRELDLALATAPGDPGERQFEPIDRNGTTLDEYITWLNDFVADGQSQLRDGSTASFGAITREAGRLANVAKDALEPDDEHRWRGAGLAVLERRPVRRALEELRNNLQAIAPAVLSGR
jgi:hypothetical protein